jgi:hypothetical protein
VFQILISHGLLDLNEVIDVEDECKHGDATRLPTVFDFEPIQSLLQLPNLVVTEIL